MQKMLIAIVCVTGLTAFSCAFDPVGKYDVVGTNPNGGEYKASAEIAKVTDDVYSIVWDFKDGSVYGEGVRNGLSIGFIYGSIQSSNFGIAIYNYSWDTSLSGVWTTLGGRKVAKEVLRKRK